MKKPPAKKTKAKKKAKKKRKPRKPPAPKALDPTVADNITLLMIAGLRHQAIVDACRDKLQIPSGQIEAAIDDARRRITRASEYDHDEMLGQAIGRLDDLYQRALNKGDVNLALSAQREKQKLLLGSAAPAGDLPGTDDGDEETTGRSAGIESDELAAIVVAIETYLDPLKLNVDINHTDADIIMIAGEEIKRFRRKQKRAKKPTAKSTAKKGKKK